MTAVRRLCYAFGLPIVLVFAWWLWTATAAADSFYYPAPQELASTFWSTWVGERFFSDILPSITRLAIGLAVTIVLGISLGVLIGLSQVVRRLLEPLLEFFRAIPPPVLVPLLMLLIGINDSMKVAVIISGSIWPVLLNTVEGVRGLDQVLNDTARAYGLRRSTRVWHVILPAASPQIMAGVRQCLAIGLILMVISEMFGSSSGLGFTIVLFQQTFAVPEMWSGIFVLGFIGIALYAIFQVVERRTLHWYHNERELQKRG